MAWGKHDWGVLTKYSGSLGELGLAAGLLLVVGVVLIPIPPLLLDLLLCGNLALSLLLLLAAVHNTTSSPAHNAALPSALLLVSLLRLALNFASTRLILQQGEAGQLIAAFGELVIHGDPLVGAVLFSVLLLVQYLVVTKGAERVAEVSARFSLDALPGLQLAIDSELRSGTVGPLVARTHRGAVLDESRFYGAMDGAMKFLRGDTLAALFICLLDLCAGCVVGIVRHGQPLTASLLHYGRLTLGDGLCAQIPALMVSTAATLIVARTTHQPLLNALTPLLGQRSLLRISAVFFMGLALVPAFPALPLLLSGAVLATLGLRPQRSAQSPSGAHLPHAEPHQPVTVPLQLLLQPRLHDQLHKPLQALVAPLPRAIFQQLGLPIPLPQLRSAPDLPTGTFLVQVHERTVQQLVLHNDQQLQTACATVMSAVRTAVHRHGDEFLTLHQMQLLLDALEQSEPTRVSRLVPDPLPPPLLLELLQRLVRAQISIRPLGYILERAAAARRDYPQHGPQALYEELRLRLRDHLRHTFAPDPHTHRIHLPPEYEDAYRAQLALQAEHPEQTLRPEQCAELAQYLLQQRGATTRPAVLLVSHQPLRGLLERSLREYLPDLPVLSSRELPPPPPEHPQTVLPQVLK